MASCEGLQFCEIDRLRVRLLNSVGVMTETHPEAAEGEISQ